MMIMTMTMMVMMMMMMMVRTIWEMVIEKEMQLLETMVKKKDVLPML